MWLRATAPAPPYVARVLRVTATDLPHSWRPGCPVGPAELRLLRLAHWDFAGRRMIGELVVHRDVAADVVAVFRRLYRARFPIRRMVRVDAYRGSDRASMAADNTSGFNCRFAQAAGPRRWSEHAYGRAIDVNPVENPYVQGPRVSPPAGRAFANRSRSRPGMAVAGGVLVQAFAARGWSWGGRWARHRTTSTSRRAAASRGRDRGSRSSPGGRPSSREELLPRRSEERADLDPLVRPERDLDARLLEPGDVTAGGRARPPWPGCRPPRRSSPARTPPPGRSRSPGSTRPRGRGRRRSARASSRRRRAPRRRSRRAAVSRSGAAAACSPGRRAARGSRRSRVQRRRAPAVDELARGRRRARVLRRQLGVLDDPVAAAGARRGGRPSRPGAPSPAPW